MRGKRFAGRINKKSVRRVCTTQDTFQNLKPWPLMAQRISQGEDKLVTPTELPGKEDRSAGLPKQLGELGTKPLITLFGNPEAEPSQSPEFAEGKR